MVMKNDTGLICFGVAPLDFHGNYLQNVRHYLDMRVSKVENHANSELSITKSWKTNRGAPCTPPKSDNSL